MSNGSIINLKEETTAALETAGKQGRPERAEHMEKMVRMGPLEEGRC